MCISDHSIYVGMISCVDDVVAAAVMVVVVVVGCVCYCRGLELVGWCVDRG